MSIIAQTLINKGLEFEVKQRGRMSVDGWECFAFCVYVGSQEFGYKMGVAHAGKIPTPDDVIPCLFSDASYGSLSFADFCSELGYDATDDEGRSNMKSRRVWEACKTTKQKLSTLRFTAAEKAAIMAYIEEEGL